MSDTREPVGRRIARAVFRLAMTVLILLLAGRTYQETAVALARSTGSLRTTEATVVETTAHTTSGTTAGGQDGGGRPFSHTEYTVQLRLGEELKTLEDVSSDAARDLTDGRHVVVRMWQGRVVEIEGRDVWPGWHVGVLDGTLIVLYPLIMGYLIALAVSARAYAAGRNGRVRLTPEDRLGAFWPGFLLGLAVIFVLIACAAFGNALAFWPVIPAGAGVTVAVGRLSRVIRRRGGPPAEDAPVGTSPAGA